MYVLILTVILSGSFIGNHPGAYAGGGAAISMGEFDNKGACELAAHVWEMEMKLKIQDTEGFRLKKSEPKTYGSYSAICVSHIGRKG